jgi:hypothetical protein
MVYKMSKVMTAMLDGNTVLGCILRLYMLPDV